MTIDHYFGTPAPAPALALPARRPPMVVQLCSPCYPSPPLPPHILWNEDDEDDEDDAP